MISQVISIFRTMFHLTVPKAAIKYMKMFSAAEETGTLNNVFPHAETNVRRMSYSVMETRGNAYRLAHCLLWTEHYLSTRYFMLILVVVSLFSVFVIPAQVNYTLALRALKMLLCCVAYLLYMFLRSNNEQVL